jgi:hypothetical protein
MGKRSEYVKIGKGLTLKEDYTLEPNLDSKVLTIDSYGRITDFNQIVNVKAYGAVGNGITDDTTAIQNAMNNASRSILYFPPGTYRTTSTITVKSYVTMLGAGATIKADHTNPILDLTGAYSPHIEGLILDGNNKASHGIKNKAYNQTVINRVTIQNCDIGMEFDHWYDNVQIINCIIQNNTTYGIYLSFCNTVTITGCFFWNNGQHIYLDNSNGIQITNSSLQAGTNGAIKAYICEKILIKGNWFESNGTGVDEILVTGTSGNLSTSVSIDDCFIFNTNTGSNGVHFGYAMSCYVKDCRIQVTNYAIWNDGYWISMNNHWLNNYIHSGSILNKDNYNLSGPLPNSTVDKRTMTDTGKAQIITKYYENISATTTIYDAPFLLQGWKLLRVNVITRGWTGNSSNHWRVTVSRINTSGTSTDLGTITCQPDTINPTWMNEYISLYTADAEYILSVTLTKVGTPANFNGYIQYVIAPTDTVYRV